MSWRLSTGLRNKLLGINTELITNGAFTSDASGWTAGNAVLSSVAGGQAGNCLQVAESGGVSPGKAYQDVTTIIGRLYRLMLYFKKGTADNGKFMVGTTVSEAAIYDSGNANDAGWTKKTVYFVATDTTTRITLESVDATNGETSLFDGVSLVDMARSFQEIFQKCVIRIFSGSQPASADNAPSGVLLCTFYSDGSSAGLDWDDASAGSISKAAAETWTGTAVATNTAGWFRISVPGDADGSSSVWERLDGACATSGAEMTMTSTAITSGAVQTIQSASITQPAS